MFLILVLTFAFAQEAVAQYTRSFLHGLKAHEDKYKLNEIINSVVSHVENKVLEAAKEGKTYYTEPFYGCDSGMYRDTSGLPNFLTKHCELITEEVKVKVQKLFPECDLAYDARTKRYILSWV